jgi:amino acid permease
MYNKKNLTKTISVYKGCLSMIMLYTMCEELNKKNKYVKRKNIEKRREKKKRQGRKEKSREKHRSFEITNRFRTPMACGKKSLKIETNDEIKYFHERN